MKTDISANELKAFIESFEDGECVDKDEYVLDLYDSEPPMSFDIIIDKKGVDVLAAYRLEYSEEEDGWYLGDKCEDAALITSLLTSCLKK